MQYWGMTLGHMWAEYCSILLADMSTDTQPTLSRYFIDNWPTLCSFGRLLLLTSIFSTQILNNLL